MLKKFDVLILMGSGSDESKMAKTKKILDDFGITNVEFRISSAHRTPVRTRDIILLAEKAGCKIIICGAGMAAHLAGAVVAITSLPVIGVPLTSGASPLSGMDALLSTVQMPSGVPVATVGIDNGKNAAWLAIRILALIYPDLKRKLIKAIEKMAEDVEKADEELQQKLADGRKETKE